MFSVKLWFGYIRSRQWRIIFCVAGLIGLAIFGLRLLLFDYQPEIYHFWHQERLSIDREWQTWASRYMPVLHNNVFLPEKAIATITLQDEAG